MGNGREECERNEEEVGRGSGKNNYSKICNSKTVN